MSESMSVTKKIYRPELGEYLFTAVLTATCGKCRGEMEIGNCVGKPLLVCACGNKEMIDRPYDDYVKQVWAGFAK